MKSKTTISRENKIHNLKGIINNVISFIVDGNKRDLSLINAWDLKEMNEKLTLWNKYINGNITDKELKSLKRKPKMYKKYDLEKMEYHHRTHKKPKIIEKEDMKK